MGDACWRGTSKDGSIRFWIADTTGICRELMRIHESTPVATAAMGRLSTAGVMMGLNLKGEDKLTLRTDGNGPLGSMIVAADASGNVRAYAEHPQIDLPERSPGHLDVGAAVGHLGVLSVIRDMGLKEPYVGTVALVSGEIGDDLAQYYLESEQTPSAVGLGVLVDRDWSVLAGGSYIAQLLPQADEETLAKLEANVRAMPSVSGLIRDGGCAAIEAQLLQGIEHDVWEKRPVAYQCDCSRDRFASALRLLGKKDLLQLAEHDEDAEVLCRFCRKRYLFSKEELLALAAEE